ncbi:hypothetical protein [Mesorhizobium sp. WSM2239]|uniref:DUF2442 domain-containing protein n=2 Tax=unclassified Mesorhizobium TaxID=325217 RepID=A0AAU8DHY0_9HYPH
MSAYLVRLRDNKEIVGIIVLDSPDDLYDFVDENTDPGLCEYRELPSGGLLWHENDAPRVPSNIEDSDESDDYFARLAETASFSELWMGELFQTDEEESGSWEAIPPRK